ncbi:7TM diverse intracellular signaling domain-containing protein [Dyadobacter sp. 32]|uniref:7TM diverse intracellular signaling domain-containing protein n=1 Tax=Dyadobacter sp. 32 TaxID=538966 RepID=UPI0011ED5800
MATLAQRAHVLNDSVSVPIHDYAILPDRGYTIDRIVSDSTLRFVVNDSLRPLKESSYWIKISINNPFSYQEKYNVWLFPYLNNTLYYFDTNLGQWKAQKAGIYVGLPDKSQRTIARMSFVLHAKSINTLYIKADVLPLRKFTHAFRPEIQLRKQAVTDNRENTLRVAWIAALSVLLLFFLNNLYLYFSFRDKTVLFYLIAQLGGMIYITSYRYFFGTFLPIPVFSFWMAPSGKFEYYDLNSLLQHAGILLVMFGYIRLTRSYLNTTKTLPIQDKILKYGWRIYALVTLCIVLINVTFSCITEFTLLYENIIALLLIIIILSVCVAGYVRKIPASGPFLMANVFPLLGMLGITVFHVFVTFHTNETFMPEFAVVAQAFGFSIALVTRTKVLQNDLKAKEIETQKLAFDVRELEMVKKLIELENQKINAEMDQEKIRNELLQQNLQINQRELASTTLYMVQKNEMLAQLKKQIQDSNQQFPDNKHQGLKGIESILNSNLYLDSDWSKFKLHFEQVHPNFFSELLAKHPSLTKNEVRLFAYFHINLSTKEIAALLNVDPGSVRRAKSRLYKKMAISAKDIDTLD